MIHARPRPRPAGGVFGVGIGFVSFGVRRPVELTRRAYSVVTDRNRGNTDRTASPCPACRYRYLFSRCRRLALPHPPGGGHSVAGVRLTSVSTRLGLPPDSNRHRGGGLQPACKCFPCPVAVRKSGRPTSIPLFCFPSLYPNRGVTFRSDCHRSGHHPRGGGCRCSLGGAGGLTVAPNATRTRYLTADSINRFFGGRHFAGACSRLYRGAVMPGCLTQSNRRERVARPLTPWIICLSERVFKPKLQLLTLC